MAAALSAAGAAPVGAVSATAHSPTVTVVASGLNNPRSVAFDDQGRLWVTEAGSGGRECQSTPGAPNGNTTCYGLTGSVDRIENGQVVRLFTGLASEASPDGSQALGPAGISVYGGKVYFDLDESSYAAPIGLSPSLAAKLTDQLGRLMWAPAYAANAVPSELANVGDFDYDWAYRHRSLVPGQFPDADPYGLLAGRDGISLADAGTNIVDHISRHGNIAVDAFIPNPPSSDAVPTCVAQGPDGALYIGELTGAGNSSTAANVYRWSKSGGLTVWQTGFSAITGCGFGPNGAFYVTEFDTTGFPPSGEPAGAVVKIARNGSRTVLGSGMLVAPNGFAMGRDGCVYVTNFSVLPGSAPSGAPTGQVVRICS
jgi:sugar lactone lactonase YvrE